jgi:hypothetical protein
MNKDIDITEVYSMRVVDTRKRSRVNYRSPLNYLTNITAQEDFIMRYEDERIFSIEMTETDLCRMHDDLVCYLKARNPYERDDMERRESFLQRTNPAVKKAWENYRMLLKLAADGPVHD